MRFWFGEDESQVVEVSAGEVLAIPPWLPHRVLALDYTDVDLGLAVLAAAADLPEQQVPRPSPSAR